MIGESSDVFAKGCDPELDPPFDVVRSAGPVVPLVLSSPHSGSVYPRRFLESSRLDAIALRRSEDAYVDELFAGVCDLGVPLIRARFPRAYLDLNREAYELDPRMFDGRLPAYVNTRSVRVAGGLGTIARVVGESQEIYAGPLDVAEGLGRIERLYKPYHAKLRAIVDNARAACGIAVLIDCHSMPSMPAALPTGQERRSKVDVVVGDRYGTSAATGFVEVIEGELRRLGYAVARNKPYAGGYITEHYGAPHKGVHAIQIEVNRALYMHEASLTRTDRFASVAEDLRRALAATLAAVEMGRLKSAAE